MGKEWVAQIAEESPFEYVYPAFLEHLLPIGITPEQIRGRVLVIGQACAFPERTLITTPESEFEMLRDGIEAVYCCDTTFPSSPETHLNIPCVNTFFFEKIPCPKPNTAYFELSSSYTFLRKVDNNFFDTVLMFRVVDTGTQIEELGLVKTIAPHLKKGGHFICSGGRFPLNPPSDFFDPLTVLKSVRLSDFSDGYPFTNNTGVILQKKRNF